MYLMNRNFDIGRARAADRLRRAERARVAAGALAGANGRTTCDANCEQAAAVCDVA